MRKTDLDSMSVDQLWELHKKMVAQLSEKIAAEKVKLEERLSQLQAGPSLTRTAPNGATIGRRPYPKVYPKYRNPDNPSETWAGRGKQPRWLRSQLRSGKKMDDFRIERA